MKSGKTSEPDNIPSEFFTNRDLDLRNHLMLFILKIWESKMLSNDFCDATIITIYKKGDREDCNNSWGISLLSILSQVFALILLNRNLIFAEDDLPESQCGFQSSRGKST